MKAVAEGVGYAIFCLVWVAGAVMASGFWSTFFAVTFPPWGCYLIVERVLQAQGLVP